MWSVKRILIGSMILSLLFFPSHHVIASIDALGDLNVGPFINSILYTVFPRMDERFIAVQAGDAEMAVDFFDPTFYDALDADPNIAIFNVTRNGYGHITINCRDAPLNESVLRRAFAYAFDKRSLSHEIYGGWSQEHDSVVPYPNGWCIEHELPWHYYTAQPEVGNALLNASGLFPYGTDGWRTYKGQSIEPIRIEYSSPISYITPYACQALETLDIPSVDVPADYGNLISRLDSHGDYDMAYVAYNFHGNDVDWLAYQYWSEYADTPFQNPTNFKNATYDACREQLLHGTTYDEVHNASAWMQRILHEQVPLLVAYTNIFIQAYRTDRFIGHVPDLNRYITGSWTMRKIHRLDSGSGGIVPIVISEAPDSFNIFKAESYFSDMIFNELWSSLFKYGPNQKPYPDIAREMLIETHADNPAVPTGRTRFTIDLIQNATWSDGKLLTAEDVASTFLYIIESGAYGNPLAAQLSNLVGVYTPSSYQVVFEFNKESYWHFSDFAFVRIIPRHIFAPDAIIDYDGWDDWNPVLDPEEPHVTCGPFLLTNYEPNQWYNLTSNPLFHYRLSPSTHETPTENDTTTNGWPTIPLIITSTISIASAFVILISVHRIYRHRRLASESAL